MISSTSLVLLATLASSLEATRRSTYKYWGLTFISPDARTQCLTNVTQHTIDADTCYYVANCILSNAPEYAKMGFASGTTLLTLIPTALSLIPIDGPSVEEAMSIGWLFTFLAAFSGYIATGKGSDGLAKEIRDLQVAESEFAITSKNGASESELGFLVRGPARWLLYFLVGAGMGTLLYLTTKLGLETIVSWACNHEFLHVGWMFVRMTPYLAELILLRLLKVWMRRYPGAASKWEGSAVSTAWLLAKTIYGFSLLLAGLVLLYGTSLLGSTNLIDGAVVIWKYLLLFPLLFCSMQMVLRALCEQRRR